MSWAFITALKKNPQQSYVQLLNSIRDELATKYTQRPQLSCSHPLSASALVSASATFKVPAPKTSTISGMSKPVTFIQQEPWRVGRSGAEKAAPLVSTGV